jgi:hypothetical protein
MTFDEVVNRFDAHQVGSSFKGCCPAHDDARASLSISLNGDRILVNCLAGCATESVLAAANLKMADLFTRSNGHQKSNIVATYEYRDLTGKVRYRKQRTTDKQFFFAKADGHGGWITSAKQNHDRPVMVGVERLVYRLDKLRERSEGSTDTFQVFIAEGEKDVDRLWSLGLPATTNDTGASDDGQKPKWIPKLTKQLKTIGVTSAICLPDNDDAGLAHMRAVAQSCTASGIEARIVMLPDLPVKGDVSDYFDAGHTAADLLALCDVPVYAPPSDVPPAPITTLTPITTHASITTHSRTLADVHAAFTKWLGTDYDLDAADAVIAAAAAERLAGDPLWLLLISGPGNAKTETVQALTGVGAITVSTIASEGALLSASPARERAKDATGGLLLRVGSRGILVIKDVTSILSMQSNTRAGVLAALREIHDGRWERNVGTNGGKTLTWIGRLVIIGAVTTAWDSAHAVISTMGDRFVLLRMDSHLGRESAGRQAIRNTGCEIEMRAELAEAVAGLLQTVDPATAITLTDADRDVVLAAANITTLCRTGVEYDYRGDPIDAHMPEMPTRFAKQLAQMIRGGVAIGMDLDEARRLAVRCARDSMPPLRLAILTDLWAYPNSQLRDVRARLNMPWNTVKRQLDSLYLLQVLTCVESVEQHVKKVEVEDAAETKTTRTLTARTTKRYRVAEALKAEALGLRAVDPGF